MKFKIKKRKENAKKFMCKECKQTYCDHACPEFDGYVVGVGAPKRYCASCEGGIFPGELYYLIGDDAVCEDCAQCLDTGWLAELFGFENVSMLIEALGGEVRRD